MNDRFVRAGPGPKDSVIYETDDGRKFCFSKGTRTWRNNNPGNLVVGAIIKDMAQSVRRGTLQFFLLLRLDTRHCLIHC